MSIIKGCRTISHYEGLELNRRKFITALLSSVAVSSATKAIAATAAEKPLIIGIFPRRNIKTTYRLFTPIAEHLEHVLQREVRIETARTFSLFWDAVKQKKYDLVHFNQYHYILSHLHYGYDVILKNKELGKSTIAGSLIVRKDSGINSVADLKGKEVLFGGDERAMQSYISATWLLRKAGLKPGDYIEKFAINPPNTIISTFFKRADASGSGDVVMYLDNVTKRIDISQLKFLAKTDAMPHLPWAVSSLMEPKEKENIKAALMNLTATESGRKILKFAQLDALVPAKDKEYDRHREIISDVYGSDYGMSKFQ